ncbi:hypothetical protein DAPPUDRAFT_120364 [Daphnia pulex]|uniref:Uncharacterized protein n=1 Tax=Daphnia pulex TaxID=6669 RepID=E9I140_DAPPU|nr:hypothetical protein DAPPUDRAFT_120364 [Daphnia pulex]|eukprot:EFX62290.1 hypothetical protein DAPPUDRAFT_120364 [Daphnia pulex]
MVNGSLVVFFSTKFFFATLEENFVTSGLGSIHGHAPRALTLQAHAPSALDFESSYAVAPPALAPALALVLDLVPVLQKAPTVPQALPVEFFVPNPYKIWLSVRHVV